MNEDCLKLTTYFGERDRAGGRLLGDALFDAYGEAGIQTSLLLRGVEGFGLKHQLQHRSSAQPLRRPAGGLRSRSTRASGSRSRWGG